MRILLADANVCDDLWDYAANQVAHIHNRLASRSHDPPLSPYEFNRKKAPDLSSFKVWGCTCYVHLDKEERHALRRFRIEVEA